MSGSSRRPQSAGPPVNRMNVSTPAKLNELHSELDLDSTTEGKSQYKRSSYRIRRRKMIILKKYALSTSIVMMGVFFTQNGDYNYFPGVNKIRITCIFLK